MAKTIKISDITEYELMKVKKIFKNLKISGDDLEDEIIKYSLRLIQSINNTKLPEKD